uniref:Protein CUSTOS n=1 Tax=Angiostrongylus cantonensis TaxID=6313 RepID=A0A0K0DRW7_ANGCA
MLMAGHVAGSFREAAKTPKRKTAEEAGSQSGHLTMIWSLMDELRHKIRSLEATTLRFMLSHYSLEGNVAMISSLLRFPPEEAPMEPEVKRIKGNGASGSDELGEKTCLLVAKKISSLLGFPPEEVPMEPEVKRVKGNGASESDELGEKNCLLVAKKHGTKQTARKRKSTKDPKKKRKAEKKLGKLSSREPGRQGA